MDQFNPFNKFLKFKNSLIFKRYDDRVEYLKYMEKACGELKILALHYSSNPNYVFEPIPYFELPIVRENFSHLEKQFCLYFFDSILEIFIECKGLHGRYNIL
jgi:hypothetical protein